MKELIFSLCCLVVSGNAFAFTGNDLMEKLLAHKLVVEGQGSVKDFVPTGFAQGFVSGVMFTLDEIDSKVCLPRGHNVGQLLAVTQRYFENNPAKLHRDAAELVREAAIQAFPCKR